MDAGRGIDWEAYSGIAERVDFAKTTLPAIERQGIFQETSLEFNLSRRKEKVEKKTISYEEGEAPNISPGQSSRENQWE